MELFFERHFRGILLCRFVRCFGVIIRRNTSFQNNTPRAASNTAKLATLRTPRDFLGFTVGTTHNRQMDRGRHKSLGDPSPVRRDIGGDVLFCLPAVALAAFVANIYSACRRVGIFYS